MYRENTIIKRIITIFIIALLTAILGELKITVFNSSFRFGLGSATFFFLLLFYNETYYILTGFFSAFFVTFYRITLDYFFLESFTLETSILNHSPIIGYYLVFVIVLVLLRARNNLEKPFLLGIIGFLADSLANFTELLIRTVITDKFLLTPTNIQDVIFIAILRSFFVVGLFNMLHTTKRNAIYNEQRKRYEQIQIISSGLYVEVFYLRKLLNQIEEITAKSFELYKRIKNNDKISNEASSIALTIAQEVHEVKKDNQRILAGLEKIIVQESEQQQMNFDDLIGLTIRANQKYASMLQKRIEFVYDNKIYLSVNKIYPLVAIINNLLANSVEAIRDQGTIWIIANVNSNKLNIKIIDDGIGIPIDDTEVIFEVGYTTKYDEKGTPSTGIGLSHVKSIIEKLKGNILFSSENNRTIFQVIFPLESLQGDE